MPGGRWSYNQPGLRGVDDRLGVALDVRRVIRQVRDRKELSKFRQDFAFMVCSPGSRIFRHGCGIRPQRGVEQDQEYGQGESQTGMLPNTHKPNEKKISHAAADAAGCKLRVELQTSS